MMCPCWYLDQEVMVMDQGWCASAFGFRFREGDWDGVDIGGLDVVFGVDFPGPTLFDGNATARLYISSRANEQQRQAFEGIYHGTQGGPFAVLAPLVTTWLESQAADIEVTENGDVLTMSVPGAGQVESHILRDPGGNGFELRGGGFVGAFGMESVQLAKSASHWSDSELPRAFETRSGARGNFSWQG
jgi:hypothetical protein